MLLKRIKSQSIKDARTSASLRSHTHVAKLGLSPTPSLLQTRSQPAGAPTVRNIAVPAAERKRTPQIAR